MRDGRTGNVLSVTAADIFPGVEIYGQHEISELTRSPEKLTKLLGRFVQKDESLDARKQALRQQLNRSREGILRAREELAQIDERLAALPGLEETLKRYQDAGLEDDLRERSLLVREERVLATVPERLEPFRSCLNELRQALPIDRTFVSPEALNELPGRKILAGADRVLEQLETDLERVLEAFDAAIGKADQGIREVHERFEARRAKVQSAYVKKLRELQKSRIDGEEFIRLRRQIEELRPLRERQVTLSQTEAGHQERRRNLLAGMGGHEGGGIPGARAGRQARDEETHGARPGSGGVRWQPRVVGSVASRAGRRAAVGGDQHAAPGGQVVAERVRAGVPPRRGSAGQGIRHLRRSGDSLGAGPGSGPDAD